MTNLLAKYDLLKLSKIKLSNNLEVALCVEIDNVFGASPKSQN